jgi:hypothetical protein
MLQKQSLSRDNAFVVVIAVGVIALTIIIVSLVSGARIESLSSILPGSAAVSEDPNLGFGPEIAEAARWNTRANEFVNMYGSTAVLQAASGLRVDDASTERWSAIAGERLNLYGSTAWVRQEPSSVVLSQEDMAEAVQLQALAGGFSTAMQVEAKRMTGMAGNFVNIYGTTPAMYVEGVERTRTAEAARLTGLAIKYGAVPSHISEAVEELIP